MRVIKRPGVLWYQGTVEIEGGGTSATTVPEALTKLGYLPISSLGQAGGTTPLVGGVIPKQYLGLSNLGAVAVMGAVRMMVGSQRTLSVTNFDSFETYSIKAKYGTVGALSTAGATAGDFLYTAPGAVPAAGYDSITINGIDFNIDILAVAIDTPSIAAPIENFSGGISSIGTFTSSAYSAGSTTIIDTVSIGGAGTFTAPTGTEKIRVLNRTGSTVVLSQAGTTKNVPANSVLEWVGSGSWIYSVLSGKVLVEALKGTNSHAASDWQIASDLQFTSLVKQSLNDTVNKVSWSSTLTQPGIYYVRVRHIDSTGNSSAWSAPRRIAPVADAPTTRQTSYSTSWTTTDPAASQVNTTWQTATTMATRYTSWNTTVSATSQNTSAYTSIPGSAGWTTSWSTSVSASRSTSVLTDGNVRTTTWYSNETWLTSDGGTLTPYYTSWTTYFQLGIQNASRQTSIQTAVQVAGSHNTTASRLQARSTADVWSTGWTTSYTSSRVTSGITGASAGSSQLTSWSTTVTVLRTTGLDQNTIYYYNTTALTNYSGTRQTSQMTIRETTI